MKDENNYEIFKYLKPDDNDELSSMDGIDLQDLMVLLDDYYLELRDKLGLKFYTRFGLEIEFEEAMTRRLLSEIDEKFGEYGWVTKHDVSLHDGGELNTPIMGDKKDNWQEIKEVCEMVEKHARIGKHSGGHVHINATSLGKDKETWVNFTKLWMVYENIIYRFAYGDHINARPNITKYARPKMTRKNWEAFKKARLDRYSLKEFIDIIREGGKYQGINFNNVYDDYPNSLVHPKNTVEFRCPNGTLDPVIWQNNVNLFTKMMYYSDTFEYDDDTIEKRRRKNKRLFGENMGNIELYDEIYLDEALEFADMVFDNNLDKIYFLKQYLKSFEISKEKDKYEPIKTLTKKI